MSILNRLHRSLLSSDVLNIPFRLVPSDSSESTSITSESNRPQHRLRLVDLRFARRFDGLQREELGLVRSPGSRVRARGSSCVDATLELDGLESKLSFEVYIWCSSSPGLYRVAFDYTSKEACGVLGPRVLLHKNRGNNELCLLLLLFSFEIVYSLDTKFTSVRLAALGSGQTSCTVCIMSYECVA
ncbi:hypothetical protein CUMW_171000 [Citrus unshiu]|nr:hypothetical protein CUMW_171000 [Citrus unshiu]